MAVNSTLKIGIVGLIGAVLCALGASLYVILPNLVREKIYENIRIVNGTDFYQAWEEFPVPIYMQFYLFNLTNANEILENSTVKPILQQLGPYTYREHRKKVNIFFDDENGTVSYEQRKWFIFEPNMTKGSLEDSITTINVPLTALATVSKSKSAFEKMVLNNLIRTFQSTVFITRTVDELLFKGYKDHLMEYIADKLKRELLPNATFGMYYARNYTDYMDDFVYVVNSGVKPNTKFLEIVSWNHSNTISFWNDKYCNMINGSDGSAFAPFVKRKDRIYAFGPEICRSMYAEYEKDVEVHGIHAYRFSTPESLLARTEENDCFCFHKGNCLSYGVIHLGFCKEGAPLVLSAPHFHSADPIYLNAVEGLNPNKHEHESYIDIEPMTGMGLRAIRRMQVNVELKPFSHIKLYKNLPDLLLPVVWMNESADTGPEYAEILKRHLFRPLQIANAIIYALIVIGSFILVIVTVVLIRNANQGKKNKENFSLKTALNEKPKLYPDLPQSQAHDPLLKNGYSKL